MGIQRLKNFYVYHLFKFETNIKYFNLYFGTLEDRGRFVEQSSHFTAALGVSNFITVGHSLLSCLSRTLFVAKFITMIVVNWATPKAGVKRELLFCKPASEAGLLIKSSCLAPPLGVTRFTKRAMILVILCRAA